MSDNYTEIDEAKFRRGMAALQRFSQNKRKQLNNSKVMMNTNNNNDTTRTDAATVTPSVSMRYNPFSQILFTRKRTGIEEILVTDHDDDEENENEQKQKQENAENNNNNYNKKKSLILFDIVDYLHIPSSLKLPPLMERNEASAATVADFKASRLGQVDNTGSFHWPAEDILAHLLLLSDHLHQNNSNSNAKKENNNEELQQQQNPSSSPLLFDWTDDERPSVIEIGAGVGLAGFALAMSGKSKHVIVTDGNWRVAKLLGQNAQRVEMMMTTKKENKPETKITAGCLPWQIFSSSSSSTPTTATIKSQQQLEMYDKLLTECQYLVGADCLFFETFHNDLVDLVIRFFMVSLEKSVLKKKRKVVFVAPSRGGSRERFLELLKKKISSEEMNDHARSLPCLRWEIIENYDEAIFAIHKNHLESAASAGYTADRHYPQVVVISYARE